MSAASNAVSSSDDDGFDFLLDLPIDEYFLESFKSTCHGEDEEPRTLCVSTTAPTPTHPKRKRQNNLVVELRTLQDTCGALQKQLEDLQQGRALRMVGATPSAAKWELVARRQQASWRKTERENRELRAVLHDQAHVKEEMEALLAKRARTLVARIDDDDDQWRLLTLSANGAKRLQAIHAIAARELSHVEGDMIRWGLLDVHPSANNDRWQTWTSATEVKCDGVHHTCLRGPMATVVPVVWDILRAVHIDRASDMPVQHHTYNLDDDTTYLRSFLSHSRHGLTFESSAICKRFVTTDETVTVVWRSLVDDELMPIHKDSLVIEKRGWFVCAPGPPASDGTPSTHLKVFMSTSVPLTGEAWIQYRKFLLSMQLDGRPILLDSNSQPAAMLEESSRLTVRMLLDKAREGLGQEAHDRDTSPRW
ncbi:Aste57867_10173 [Aphanomyces stellatus]|uniref:Aste57867_10173 protein n=1 Tax=Aphanomyces stellatus TaxID=120398 RepID=A0A485KQF5_9STRA|nr:hypothetical protein As57867_010134 [Aphanomyces stellatus]VFT87049.1 Aste57867_10173 [Aphanomyces stellatus]